MTGASLGPVSAQALAKMYDGINSGRVIYIRPDQVRPTRIEVVLARLLMQTPA